MRSRRVNGINRTESVEAMAKAPKFKEGKALKDLVNKK